VTLSKSPWAATLSMIMCPPNRTSDDLSGAPMDSATAQTYDNLSNTVRWQADGYLLWLRRHSWLSLLGLRRRRGQLLFGVTTLPKGANAFDDGRTGRTAGRQDDELLDEFPRTEVIVPRTSGLRHCCKNASQLGAFQERRSEVIDLCRAATNDCDLHNLSDP
jgi:hypothetical protein